ncbi:MAG: type II toxin-antitoxin system Phd/YefM family antitoxin [bacterium]
MKTVGIRNLKNSLSQYINLVKTGERILVTEHDRIVAEIIPSTGGPSESNLLEDYLSDQVKSGLIVRAKKKIKLKKVKGERRPNRALLEEIYNKTRADRA